MKQATERYVQESLPPKQEKSTRLLSVGIITILRDNMYDEHSISEKTVRMMLQSRLLRQPRAWRLNREDLNSTLMIWKRAP